MAWRHGIALGSNLGDRLANLQRVRAELLSLAGEFDASSRQGGVYETDPVDCPAGSPRFLNTALELKLPISPEELLPWSKRLERALGRDPRGEWHAPRVIDVDLLYAADDAGFVRIEPTQVLDLTLPHPRMAERLFVMRPLTDARPELILPGWPGTAKEIAERLEEREGALRLFASEW